MKVPASTVTHEGNLDLSTKTRLSFDENSIAHLMSVLTDLYSDPVLAVIREYSCNALDSHVAAENPDPIRIYLPNRLDSTFRVVDFGVGLSVDEITNLFSKYGWSSKRDTDGEVGMLGLGCKSGLTYTSQFTLIAVKDGVKTTVLVTRDTDGVGALQVLDTCATDLPTGVEIRIPVKDQYAFNRKAVDFFQFWAEGTVLVDDAPPVRIGSDEAAMWLDPDVLVTTSLASDYVVMGNVPYPVPYSHSLISTSSGHHAVVWVPIGAIDFTPSREALHLTTRTKEVLREAKEYIQATSTRVAQGEINAAPTHWDAYKLGRKWAPFIGSGVLQYKGDKVPNMNHVSGMVLSWFCPDWETSKYDTASQKSNVSVEYLEQAWFVTGHNALRLTQADKTRLWLYRKEHKIPHNRVYVAPEMHGMPWMEGATKYVTDWSEIRKIQLTAAKRPEVQFMIGDAQSATQAYVLAQDARKNDFPSYLLKALIPDLGLAIVPKALLKSWLKASPGSVPVDEVVKKAATAFASSLSATESFCIDFPYTGAYALVGEILDPDLTQFVPLTRQRVNVTGNKWREFTRLCNYFRIPIPTRPDNKSIRDAVKRYPLLEREASGTVLAEYVNAVYAYRSTSTVKD